MVLYEPTNSREPDKRQLAKLARQCSLPLPVLRVLYDRGMRDAHEIGAFLNPELDQLPPPLLLHDMKEAVALLRASIERGERIFLFGDYDVDGVCAISILYEHITRLGGHAQYKVPDRREGYGLSIRAVEEIAQKAELLITLDCGITNLDEIARAHELGLKTIVTDHHQCLPRLPEGIVVNPHRPDSAYPFKQLCGTGVAFKLIEALSGTEALEPYLDRAALATVADIVPLTGENRVIVANGLRAIERGTTLGVRVMLERSGILNKAIKASHLAFAVAPRINAAGRIGDAMRAVELLTTSDEKRAKELAAELDDENKKRQGIEQEIMSEALQMLEHEDLVERRAIMLVSEKWHPGVTGIVASRLSERFYKPVLLFHEEDGMLTASGRSIPSIHLFDALNRFSELFTRFGGHSQAAGLTMEKHNYERFKGLFLEHMRTYPNELFLPVARYDAQVRIRDVDAALVGALEKLAPFGFGNPAPVLRVRAAAVNARTMGSDRSHLRFSLTKDGATLPVVGFSMGKRLNEFMEAKELDVLLCAEMDTYRGGNAVRCVLRYARPDKLSPAGAIIKRSEHIFFESFLRDARLKGDCAELAVTGDASQRMEELLSADIQGTLIIARTPSGAKSAIQRLDELGLRGRVALRFRTFGEDPNAYNTLLLAPELDLFDPGRFKHVLVYDGSLTQSAAAALERMCKGMLESAESADASELLRGVDTGRNVMAEYYRALRQLAALSYDYPHYGALLIATQKYIKSAHRKQLSFALRVFEELGFLHVDRSTGFKLSVGEEAKKELSQSPAYTLALNAIK